MQVYLQALGCRLNEAELETWADQFRGSGASLAPTIEDAQLAVLNTCAVTAEAVRKSRQTLHRLHRSNPEAKIVVTGCHATLSSEEVAGELGVDLVVDNSDKDNLVALARAAELLPTMPEIATTPAEPSLFLRNRQRAFIKVQDGCRYRCTYCIVTALRGAERSRPIAEVVSEINRLSALGVQEAVLTGVHVGGYGSDNNSSLSDLVRAILEDTDLPRLRFASVEPWDLPPDFWSLFANPRLMPHMHLPLQSGSDTVLRRMARRCKVQEFEALIQAARDSVQDFNVTTDIIVGFPGETEAEWSETMATVERIGFGHLHIFNYSRREGTKAARLPDPVDKATRVARSRELHTRAAEQKSLYQSQFIGRTATVLWEGRRVDLGDGTTLLSGYSDNYLRVHCSIDNNTLPTTPTSRVRLNASVTSPRGPVLTGSLSEAAPT